MNKVDKNLYNKEFDKMFKLDKDGAMTNIDCYVCNLENKINILNKGIDELIEKYNKRYDRKGFYLDVENTMICEFIKDLEKLKGE